MYLISLLIKQTNFYANDRICFLCYLLSQAKSFKTRDKGLDRLLIFKSRHYLQLFNALNDSYMS